MLNVMRNLFSKPTRIAVLGNPVRDAYLDVDAIAFPAQRVCFRRDDAQFDLAYQGDAIRFGEKRYAQRDLSTLNLGLFTVRNGGGVFHTGTQLARLCAQRRLKVAMTAVDLVQPWPELAEAYQQLGIAHCSLELTAPATNLVLTNGKPDRLILKSPDPATALTTTQAERLRKLLPQRLDLLVVNSLRSTHLARVVTRHAQQMGAAQYSVLTPSLALEARVVLQLQRDRASVCNLSEFVQIAQAFGIPCPNQEESAPLVPIAEAMMALARLCPTGDLVVTLGARGCLTADRTTGEVVHVALQESVSPCVQEQVLAHPERKNGVGDRFFGAFVLAHALMKRGCHNRTAAAARFAALEMARQLAPTLTPERHWGVEQLVVHGFGMQQGRQLHSGRGEKTTLLPKWSPSPAAALS